MSTENIVIIIREDGSREVSRNINLIGSASTASQRGVDSLKSALRGLAGAMALSEIAKYADIWTMARGKINIFTHSAEETTQVMERLFKIAQDTRQPIDGVASSFHQLSIAGSALGASQEQLLTFTEAIGKALAIQGTDANTARGGILQLGQAMNEGIVRAQEYNSMINAMPIVLKTVANNLEGVGGSLAKLRQRMLDGKLYSKDFFEALLKGAPQLGELFDKSGKTISQSFTVLRNAMIKFIGETDQAASASGRFYDASKFLADNIEHVAKALVIMVAPAVLVGLNGIVNALRAMAVAAAANPFVAIAAGVTMALTALYLYQDQIILAQEGQVSLGDYAEATWDVIVEGAGNVVDFFKNDFLGTIGLVQKDFEESGVKIKEMFVQLGADVNAFVGQFVGLGKSIGIVAAGIGPAMKDGMYQAINGMVQLFADGINKLIDMSNSLREKVGLDLFEHVTFDPIKNSAEGQAKELGTAIQDAFKESLSVDYIGKVATAGGAALDELSARASAIAKARHDAEKAGPPIDLSKPQGAGENYAKPGAGGLSKSETREREALLKSLRSETEQIEAEYKKRNELIMKYTSEGTAERDALMKKSDELRLKDTQELNEKMTGSYLTENEKLKQVYEQRTQMILANTSAGSQAQIDMMARLKEQQTKDEAELAQQQQAKIDSLYSGLLTEEEQIMQSYERRKQMIMDATQITETQRADLIKRSEAQLIKDQQELETQRTTMLLSSAGGLFDAMANVAATAGGKQTAAYKVLFAASKAFALANAIVNMQAAISSAAASGPFPANLGFMATMAANMAGVISAIQGVAMTGQAHDGYDSIPKSGTWNLEKGERVVDKRTNADLKGYLAGAGEGSGSGGGNVIAMQVNIHNNMGDQATVSTQQGSDENGNPTLDVMIDQIEDALASRVGSGKGTLHKSIGTGFGLRSSPTGA